VAGHREIRLYFPFENRFQPMGEILNCSEIAKVFGVSHTTINTWIREGLPAIRGSGRGSAVQIDSAEAVLWRVSRIFEQEFGRPMRTSELALEQAYARGANEMLKLIKSGDAAIANRLGSELATASDPAVIRAKLFTALRENRAAAAARLEHWAAGSVSV
jgi:phage terminase Nu1 subunit (DNA packaging protein)